MHSPASTELIIAKIRSSVKQYSHNSEKFIESYKCNRCQRPTDLPGKKNCCIYWECNYFGRRI